jgi:thiol-disulfide isomerase/thioredoxin
MIEGMFGRSVLNNGTSQPQQQPNAASVSMLQNISNAAASSAAPSKVDPVQIVSNLGQLNQLMQQYKAVIVFFTSASCPPCQMIKPEFQKMMTDKNEGYQQIRILGVIADVGMAYDIGAKYMIRSTPTFQLFLNGQKVKR